MVIDKAWEAIGKPGAGRLPASLAAQNRQELEWRRLEKERRTQQQAHESFVHDEAPACHATVHATSTWI